MAEIFTDTFLHAEIDPAVCKQIKDSFLYLFIISQKGAGSNIFPGKKIRCVLRSIQTVQHRLYIGGVIRGIGRDKTNDTVTFRPDVIFARSEEHTSELQSQR